jgi:hypothetical protein
MGNLRKVNCWEFKQCGRELGGSRTGELGLCPAASDRRLNGVHDGKNAGRGCWTVAGTLCSDKVTGTFAQTIKNCMECDFYNAVRQEERLQYQMAAVLIKMLEGAAP